MRTVAIVLLATVFAGTAVGETGSEREERGKWRFSVGASVIGGVRPRLGANAARMTSLSGFGSMLGGGRRGGFGRSRADAYAAGSGEAAGGVRMFDGGAWFDPVDSANANDPEWSWNWRLHDPSASDIANHGKAFVERTAYSEYSESMSMSIDGGGGYSSDSSEWFPGLRVEAARELYRSEGGRPWGVDIAVAFAYYFQRGLWKADGMAANASEGGSERSGYYEWWNDSYDTAQYILDYERESQYHDGMWGAGSFYGPGAELAVSPWQVREVGGGGREWSSSHSLRYSGNGDYREYSIEILARPWWEPWEWLRIFGSIGLEISRREFEWSMAAVGTDGSRYSENGEEKDWRLLGLLGGGLALQWHDFVLAGEALWRFGGDDLEVNGNTVSGKIENGDWGFRLSLGYEF